LARRCDDRFLEFDRDRRPEAWTKREPSLPVCLDAVTRARKLDVLTPQMKRRRIHTNVAGELETPLVRIEANLLGARAQKSACSKRLFFEVAQIFGIVLMKPGRFTGERVRCGREPPNENSCNDEEGARSQ